MKPNDDDSGRFDRDELCDWKPVEPAADFADRTMALIEGQERARPARRWVSMAAAFTAGAAVAAALVLLIAMPRADPAQERGRGAAREPASGQIDSEARQTVDVAGRARVVAEAGAALSWRVSAAGAVSVEHSAGEAFYRIDDASAGFEITTPQGDVTVTGTCLSIEVGPAHTEIQVHEGRARAGGQTLTAGDRFRITRRGARLVQTSDSPTPVAPPRTPAVATAPVCLCEEDIPSFEPGAEHLARWARECRVRADTPLLGLGAVQLEEYAAEITPDAAEQRAVIDALVAVEQRADEQLADIYLAATGAEPSGVPIAVMFEAVLQSADVEEHAVVSEKLARERAGLASGPADLSAVSPYEELIRRLAGLGDDLEAELANALGKARAHQLRKKHGGWPGPGLHMAGCPDR